MYIIDFFRKKWNRFKTYFLLILKVLLFKQSANESNNILLVEGGHIGDAVIDATAWEALINYYVHFGKNIYFLSSKNVWSVLNLLIDTGSLTYLENPQAGIAFATEETRKQLQHLEFDTIVVRTKGSRALLLVTAATRAKHRYAIAEQQIFYGGKRFITERLLSKYDNVIIQELASEREVLEKLLHSMGLNDYRMNILPIPKQHDCIDVHRSYITVAVDSLDSKRRWETEKFISLIGQLMARWDDDIYITGSALSEREIVPYYEAFHNVVRVKIMVGQLSFSQWIELLRGARFHIGVDSGSIHIAAAVGTIAFCLAGVWHGHMFFPYDYKNDLPGTRKPICIYRKDVNVDELKCFGCVPRNDHSNRSCQARCVEGYPRQCLSAITVNNVIEEIDKAKRDGVIC